MSAMAAIAAFGKRLECPICLTVCTAPVTLPCSHFFCRGCIVRHKDEHNAAHHASTLQFKQPKRKAGEFDCPVCRLPCNHRQTAKDDTLDTVTDLFRQLRQLVEDESGMQLSQDVPLHTHSIPPPNNSPPRLLYAPATATSARKRRSRSPVAASTGRRGRGRPVRRVAAPSLHMEDEDDDEEEEEEAEEEEDEEEEQSDGEAEEAASRSEERKEAESVNGVSETSESSQKENVDPVHNTGNAVAERTRRSRKSQQRLEEDMEVDDAADDVPLWDEADDQPTPAPSSLSSLARPRTRPAAPQPAPDLFALRQPPSTPTYARQARDGNSASPASTSSHAYQASLSASKAHSQQAATTPSPRHIQRATSMSMRRKLTTYTLLTSHLDDDQLALVKELEALINHQHSTSAAVVPTTSHPRVTLTTTYSPAVTHLITSASTATAHLVTHRTNKYFLALLTPHTAIVTIDWVTESVVARRLLDAAPYAVRGDSRWPQGGEARRLWFEREDGRGSDGGGLLGGCVVGEIGVWSNRVVRDDVRAVVEVGGGQWVGCDEPLTGAVVNGCKRYVVFDDGKKVANDNRAALTDEVVRSYEERGISAVPCSWLFDCVSSFSILPVPPLRQQPAIER